MDVVTFVMPEVSILITDSRGVVQATKRSWLKACFASLARPNRGSLFSALHFLTVFTAFQLVLLTVEIVDLM